MYDVADIGILGGRIGCRDTYPVLWLLPRFAAISENLYFRLNTRLERDNHLIRDGNEHQLLPPLWLGCQTTRADFQPRSLRLSQYRHSDERIVRLRLYTHDA